MGVTRTVTHTNSRTRPITLALLATLLSVAASISVAQDADPRVNEIISRLGIEEAPTPVRERKNWRPPKKIVMLGSLPDVHRNALASAAPGAKFVLAPDMPALLAEIRDADAVLGVTSTPGICDAEVVEQAKQLRWIFATGAGVELCMELPRVRSGELLVTNLRAVGSDNIAEHAIALMLALARRIDTFVLNQQQALWKRDSSVTSRMQSLHGKTLLVVGLGGIGTEVARRAHGIGMRVIATRSRGRTGPDFVSHVGSPDEMLTLAKTADVIVNAVPLTPETTGIYDAKFFAALKPNALFINVARGGSVVTADLIAALTEGRIAGAGLDVTDPEPLPPDHPLWRAPNVIISPHVSGASDVPGEHRWVLAREMIRRYAAGEKMLSVVDPERGY
jgi:phosphoglycerate dehydrogenase-like enzyme